MATALFLSGVSPARAQTAPSKRGATYCCTVGLQTECWVSPESLLAPGSRAATSPPTRMPTPDNQRQSEGEGEEKGRRRDSETEEEGERRGERGRGSEKVQRKR